MTTRPRTRRFLFCLASAFLPACVTSPTGTPYVDPPDAPADPDAAPSPPAAGPQVLPPADRPAPEAPPAEGTGGAVIRPGDSLDISVFGHQELSRVVGVQPDGSIAFPFLGRLVVKGRSVEAIAREIAAALEKDYSLRDPRVSVSVSTFGARSVYVLGRVRQSGSHDLPLNRPLTLLQLVSLAGGFEEDADRSRVLVQRTREDGTRLVFTVDLTGVERDGRMDEDIGLRDSDTVFVPRAGEVSVLGQVNRPGTFVLKSGRPMTILRAIAQAEGFTRLARPSSVIWIRREEGGAKTWSIDAEAILSGLRKDPPLSPGDIVFVPERAW